MESLGLQTVTLSDGTTAYIQQAVKGEKLLEGQVIQLEDGTTAYIHQVTVQKGEGTPRHSCFMEGGPAAPTEEPLPGTKLQRKAGIALITEPLSFEDGQPVQLEDGSMAYIHRTPKEGYDPSALEAVQLEDGSTAYIHHPAAMPSDSTILAVQTEVGLEDLAAEDDEAFSTDTVVALEQYASKVLHDSQASHNGKGQQVGDRAFRCGYKGCGRLYTTAHHLKVHERAHTGDRPYRCDFPSCGKAFATGYGLKSHVRTHTGEKPYKCPEELCSKAFKTSGDLSEVKEEGDDIPAQMAMVTEEDGAPQVALITQDGAQQVSLSPVDLQALGSAISMVTQHSSTTLTIPSHDDDLATSGTHTVTMVSADGTQTQPVTIITSGAMMADDSSVASLHHQQVALLATANGTHIAVQLEEQQTLEEAISVATAAMQQGAVTLETTESESGC